MNKPAKMTVLEGELVGVPVVKNPRHKQLADLYLSGRFTSMEDAAIECGYSPRSAKNQAGQILGQPDVRLYMDYVRQGQTAEVMDVRARVTQELSDMAYFNLADVSTVDEDGEIQVDFTNADPKHFKAVTKVKKVTRTIYDKNGNAIGTEKRSELGFADKYRGLELLARMHGLLKDPDQKVVVDVADRLLGARARLKSLGSDDQGGGGAGV